MKLGLIFLSGLATVIFAIQWYMGETVPAWVPMIWAGATLLHDISDYLENRV